MSFAKVSWMTSQQLSRHGDIGIDSIQQGNWVSGLTLTKVLISIQSLLTDPYCDVCMEPEVPTAISQTSISISLSQGP